MAWKRTNRKRNASSPYKRPRQYKSQPTARISQNGVGGAANSMTPKPMPPAQEVKTFDAAISGTTSGNGFNHIVVQAVVGPPAIASHSPIAGIVVGAASNQRIGRQIRVVGIVIRGQMTTADGALLTEGLASTMDVIWDKQPNGVLAPLSTIYDFAGSATSSIINLPNANFAKRYTFVKRLETTGRAGIPTAQQIINCTIKTNRLVNFDASTNGTTDVESNNLLITFASVDSAAQFTGVVRFLYVDA